MHKIGLNTTLIGVLFSFFSSATAALGNVLIRKSFLEVQEDVLKPEKPLYTRPKWIFGTFLVTILNSLFNMGAYNFASSSVIIPLGGTQIVLNYILSYLFFGEYTCWRGNVGMILLVTSMVGIALAGDQSATSVPSKTIESELLHNTDSVLFIITWCILIVALSVGMYLFTLFQMEHNVIQDEPSPPPVINKDSTVITPDKAVTNGTNVNNSNIGNSNNNITNVNTNNTNTNNEVKLLPTPKSILGFYCLFSAACLSGLFGGMTNVLFKFIITINGEDKENFIRPFSVFCFIFFLFCAISQLTTLNLSLKTLPTIIIVPSTSACLMLTGSLGGVILLNENLLSKYLYWICFVGVLTGILMIAFAEIKFKNKDKKLEYSALISNKNEADLGV